MVRGITTHFASPRVASLGDTGGDPTLAPPQPLPRSSPRHAAAGVSQRKTVLLARMAAVWLQLVLRSRGDRICGEGGGRRWMAAGMEREGEGDRERMHFRRRPNLWSPRPDPTSPVWIWRRDHCAGLAASGGADDSVRLYDLPSAADLGPLLDHFAAVSALAFYSRGPVPRNLLAACDDGAFHLYDADGFALLTTLRAFPRREAVEGLAVHPSGRVALAVGRAGALAIFNLVRGRRSFACRLERPAPEVAYAQDATGGDRFVLAAEDKVTVHDSVDAKIIHERDCGKRVLAFAPVKALFRWVSRQIWQPSKLCTSGR